jgi:hypothetical protein
MPFCRKCGRRLVEYSEVCTDCGTSTTSPIINTKRAIGTHAFRAVGDKKIARAIIPDVSPVQIKVISDKPAKAVAVVKAVPTAKAVAASKVASVQKAVTQNKASAAKPFTPVKIAPLKITPPKPVEPPKPVLSSKHIVKAKKAKQTKPAAKFTLTHARPVAGLEVPPSMPVTIPTSVAARPKPAVIQPKTVVVPPKPAAPQFPEAIPTKIYLAPEPAAAPPLVIESAPEIYDDPVVPIVALPKPKPVIMTYPPSPPKPVPQAPIYPPHEIIKAKVSLKEDILAHPHDYETETFEFDLICPNKHFWREGTSLPVSKGKAYCLKCGERLSKPRKKTRRRYHRY